jgi:hypothetical protein
MNSLRRLSGISLAVGLLLSFITSLSAQAQTPARVAFTTNDRSMLYFVDGAGNLDSSTIFNDGIVQMSHLAILGSNSTGKTLLIAAHVIWQRNTDATPDSADAFLAIDSPFVGFNNNDIANPFFTTSPVRILKRIGSSFNLPTRVIPTGAITPDDQHWYATWCAGAPGTPQLWFFHGSLSKSDLAGIAPVDQVQYVDGQTGNSGIVSDFHMTNLGVSPNSGMMLAVVVDNLANSVDGAKYHAITWTPASSIFTCRDFQSTVSHFGGDNLDFHMGFGIRSESDGQTADFIMPLDSDGDLGLANYNYTQGGSVGIAQPGTYIAKGVLPSGEYFFDFLPGTEQVPTGVMRGNAGDIQFIGNSDSLLFVTHDINESGNQSKSELFLYDGTTSKSLYNFAHKQELDPVFMPATSGAVQPPPKPGYIATTIQSLNFGTHGVPGDSSLTVVFQNPSGKSVEINSATISGTNAADFQVVSNTKGQLPLDSLKAGDSIGFVIKYTASKPVHTSNASLVVSFANSDSSRSISLSGNSKDTSTAGVSFATASSLRLSITPNPFTSSTKIVIEAAADGMMNLEVRDVLGRAVYTAKPEMMGAGESRSMNFDAHALGLADGVYYLNANIGGASLTRQLVLIH